MIEILYRAKRVDNGEWVYGYYFYDNQSKKAYITFGNNTYKLSFPREMCSYYQVPAFEVNPETVRQYIVLTDKNGTKIFEGDICRYGEYIGVIEWDVTDSMFVFKYEENDVLNFSQIWGKELEIVGNIHDTPELLEVKND